MTQTSVLRRAWRMAIGRVAVQPVAPPAAGYPLVRRVLARLLGVPLASPAPEPSAFGPDEVDSEAAALGPGEVAPGIARNRIRPGADLRGADLRGAILIGADLTEAYLNGADLYRADLTGANLSYTDLIDADLTGANLMAADLTSALLYRADLTGANLIDANLTGASLSYADLTDADLYRADLSGANLHRVDLTGANLTGALLVGTRWSALTVWPDEQWAARMLAGSDELAAGGFRVRAAGGPDQEGARSPVPR